jgi:hypothetical protein
MAILPDFMIEKYQEPDEMLLSWTKSNQTLNRCLTSYSKWLDLSISDRSYMLSLVFDLTFRNPIGRAANGGSGEF